VRVVVVVVCVRVCFYLILSFYFECYAMYMYRVFFEMILMLCVFFAFFSGCEVGVYVWLLKCCLN